MAIDKVIQEILELKKDSIPSPWHFDNGNWEIESRSKEFYRHSVCAVSSADTRACNNEATQFTCGLETPELIVLMRNNIEEIITALEQAKEMIEEVNQSLPEDIRKDSRTGQWLSKFSQTKETK